MTSQPTGREVASATAAIVGAVICFACSHAFVKLTAADVQPAQILFLRSIVMGALMLVLLPVMDAGASTARAHRAIALRAGLTTLSLLCLFMSLKRLDMAAAMAIHFTAIPMAAVVSFLLHRRVRSGPIDLAAGGIGFVGLVLMIGPSPAADAQPIAFAALSAVLAAASQLLLGRLSRSEPTPIIILYLSGVGAMLTLPTMFRAGPPASPSALLIIVLVAVLAMLAQWLTTHALVRTSNSYVAPFQYLVVVVGQGIDVIFWQRSIGPSAILGAAVCVLAAAFCCAAAIARCEASMKTFRKA